MWNIRKELEQRVTKKHAHNLHVRYMALAFEAQTQGNRPLFENYYQRAEHYLHLMNKLSGGFPVIPPDTKMSAVSLKKKKVICPESFPPPIKKAS